MIRSSSSQVVTSLESESELLTEIEIKVTIQEQEDSQPSTSEKKTLARDGLKNGLPLKYIECRNILLYFVYLNHRVCNN